MAIRRLSRPTLTTLTKLGDAREASWTRPRRDMQGCGGRRRIACWASVLLLLEYGVQCLPLTLQIARSGPSRCIGNAQRLASY